MSLSALVGATTGRKPSTATSFSAALKIGDIARDGFSAISQGAFDNPTFVFQRRRQRAVILGVELGELLAVTALGVGKVALRRLVAASCDTAEPLADIDRPVDLAEFAVVDDVDARLRLLSHDIRDALAQTRCIGGFVVGSDLPVAVRETRATPPAAAGCPHGLCGYDRYSARVALPDVFFEGLPAGARETIASFPGSGPSGLPPRKSLALVTLSRLPVTKNNDELTS